MYVGYMILKKGAVFAYPLVGIGGGDMSVLITDRTLFRPVLMRCSGILHTSRC